MSQATFTIAYDGPALRDHSIDDAAVEKIKDGTITGYVYDPKSASLVKHSTSSLPRDLP